MSFKKNAGGRAVNDYPVQQSSPENSKTKFIKCPTREPINFTPSKGIHIYQAANMASALSQRFSRAVKFDFNDVSIVVSPMDKAEDVTSNYIKLCAHRRGMES